VTFAAFAGWLLLMVGLFRAVTIYRAHGAPGRGASLLLSILIALLGLVLLIDPSRGAVTLTYVLIAYFIAHAAGSFSIAWALRSHTGRWIWLALGGLIDLFLAALVISSLSKNEAPWLLGLYVGINLLFTGSALISAAIGARSA
jgi:uncharacterized membrane protein HdeD (DUF308 family)